MNLPVSPKEIKGPWHRGWALDRHSRCLTPPPARHTPMSDALWKLKMEQDTSEIAPIAETVASFIRSQDELSDIAGIIPIPPSDTSRAFQPVSVVAQAVGAILCVPCPGDYLLKTKHTALIRTTPDRESARRELEGAFRIADLRFAGRHILLLDDVFRSGETLSSACRAVQTQGKASRIFVLTLTWIAPAWERD